MEMFYNTSQMQASEGCMMRVHRLIDLYYLLSQTFPSGVYVALALLFVNFEKILHSALEFLLLAFNK